VFDGSQNLRYTSRRRVERGETVEVIITTDGKRIMARIPYANGSGPKLAKQVPGARADWDKTQTPNVFKGWVYPLSMDTCRSFRKVFGTDLMVSNALVRWAREEVAKEQKLEDFREEVIDSVTFELLASQAPDLLKAMRNRPYQLAGTAFLLASKAAILADDPGLGKTLQTLAALIESDAKTILVACRRSATRTVWERETLRWDPGIATFVAQGSPKEREAAFNEFSDFPTFLPGVRKMLIINIEMIRAKKIEICPETNGDCAYGDRPPANHVKHKYNADYKWPFLFGQTWDAIVLDESHNLLASTANIQSKRITQQRFGAMKLRSCLRPGGLAIALSGTPFRSKLVKGWGTLNWLRPDLFGSYWRWATQHFGVEDGKYGKVVGKGEKSPDPVDEEAWDRMLRPFYLKRTKAEVVPDLPPIAYAGTPIRPEEPDSPCYVQLDMLPEQARAYRQMEADAEVTLDGRRMTATGVLAEITRLRQFANASGRIGPDRSILPALPSNKLEWLVDFMEEREGTGAKVVVASSFSAIVELAASVLRDAGFEVLTLTGATKDRDRSDLVARFQDPNDSLQVVCINRIAGGESITLDAADEMVVLDQPWISDQDDQLEPRIHRVSRIHQVTVYRLVSTGTIDEWMASLTDEQRETVSKASPRKLSELMKEAREEMAA
jgi:SNF2 family DNA or RNA helicase